MSKKSADPNSETVYDYTKFKALPRTGLKSNDNSRWYTLSLFVETCPEGQEEHIRWCLSEHEQPHPKTGRIMPSAWQVYLHAGGEYNAMRILVGSAKQWEALKALKWFRRHWEEWELDLQMKHRSDTRQALISIVKAEQSGTVSAAKLLLEEFNTAIKPEKQKGKGKAGRPENESATEDAKKEAEKGETLEDADRVIEFLQSRKGK
jgi:hypothetical protein